MATSPPARGARATRAARRRRDVIEPGDLLLLDFSVVVSGYRGDFTNTFAVGGGPTAGQQRALRGVRRVRCTRARPASSPARPHATSTPPSAGISRRWGSTSTSRPTRATDWAWAIPSLLISSRRAAIRSQVGDVVALEPGLYVEGKGGMRLRAELPDHGRWLRDALEPRAPDLQPVSVMGRQEAPLPGAARADCRLAMHR